MVRRRRFLKIPPLALAAGARAADARGQDVPVEGVAARVLPPDAWTLDLEVRGAGRSDVIHIGKS